MLCRRLVALVLLCSGLAPPSLAQTSIRNRLDLDEIKSLPGSASSPYGKVVVGFYPTDSNCPEQHGTVEIKAGVVSLHHLELARSVKLSELSPKAVSDDEWQYQIETSECRIALNVRLKLRTDTNNWRQALLPYLSRPSVTMDEKQAILRDTLARARERTKTAPPPRWPQAQALLWSLGETSSSTVSLFFQGTVDDATPPNCFRAVGTYDMSRRGIAFTFLGELSDLNHFAIEREDIDKYATRLHFVGGDCRLEITVSGSTWYHFDWTPLQID